MSAKATAMACTGTCARTTELDFVTALADRSPHTWDCTGPIVSLPLPLHRVEMLEAAWLGNTRAVQLLWNNLDENITNALQFRLCAVHWFDLACLAGTNGRTYDRQDWRIHAAVLLCRVCRAAGWDPREISNMLDWQRVRLT